MSLRRMLPFILINIFVSASVVLAILFWWDSRQTEPEPNSAIIPAASVISTDEPSLVQNNVPTEEPVLEVSDGPETYVVKAGDTLGSISRELDVSLDLLMEVNGIDNPNFLQVDQVLIIPGDDDLGNAGIETESSEQEPEITVTETMEALPSPIPTFPLAEGEAVVEISEITGVGDINEEAVAITNSGDRPIALLGWRLTDEDGRSYTFGQVTLFGEGAAILIHSGSGPESPADLFWGFDDAIWTDGETATLLDAEGTVRATYVVGSS